MHSLLARQIRKFLDQDSKSSEEMNTFFMAINKSYQNYEDQFSMLQRAMSISSQELFDANQRLQQEAEQQKKVIASLTDATKMLQSITFKNEKGNQQGKELTGIELANLIEKQAFQISEIERQREVLLKDLEKSNRDLNDYAHVVSHDLKSPLRTINTLINWIKEDNQDNLEATTKDNLDLIDQNIEKMDNLINGILEYSVVDDKTRTLEYNIDLNDLIKEIIHLTQIPDHIHISTKNTLPVIYADPSRIKQLFQNLITNAIKAMDKERGEIYILFQETDNFWQFAVQDNGKGISKKYHNKIFEIFQTLDDKKISTGIGLSIVKKIVEFYDGKIWIESKEGVGTTFNFTLKKE
ncbi:GHKL domain-containing protein [Aquimarina sp. AD10]|uniref:sensor histidine kinase n=2 Tax=Aquimarina sp. AD10 TaxID=1714849 RepID=UPI000E4EDD8F|nr:ATP-binding protein [Aquimarina sp. AD10]AXT62722.1 GHKL domain-containing protein [Aquimarina sp. AD10]RKN01905.1 GHKL domain-containing protein [Aquimarina sp. AD10]